MISEIYFLCVMNDNEQITWSVNYGCTAYLCLKLSYEKIYFFCPLQDQILQLGEKCFGKIDLEGETCENS